MPADNLSKPPSTGLVEEQIVVQDIVKSFGHFPVIKGVSFSVAPGTVTVLIGRSGSGKSTVLRCLNRLERIDGGSIRVGPHNLTSGELNLHALRLDVGIVFQAYNLFPHLTLLQNVSLAPRAVRKLPKGQALDIALEVLDRVGLADKRDHYPDQLSGGQQQRGAIARSLAMAPKVMLFDEVTSALDPELTAEVLKVISQLAEQGMTMVMVTHEMRFAQKVADQIIYIDDGKVCERGTGDMIVRPRTNQLAKFLESELH